MQSAGKHIFSTLATDGETAVVRPEASSAEIGVGIERDVHAELNLLNEIVRLLPAGVTVQDEHGRFLLVNDAAAARLKVSAEDVLAAPELVRHRETCIELLRADRAVVTEECAADGQIRRTYLTTHRPVRIADAKLLLTSVADISEQKAIQDELFRRAYYDELTGLPTRRVIERHVNDLLHDDDIEPFALAFLDVDNFKHINDYYGHAIGDALLVEVARRLGLDLRDSDMLSRISGDEFLLLLNPIRSQQEVAEYIQYLLQRLRAPFFVDGSEVFASASIGVSLYPEHGRSYDALRQNADIAMYRVKNEGKGAAVFFDVSMEREALARMELEQSLRLAILDKKFCCAFQPKVDIRTREIKGIEALVRLRNDEGVLQAPGTFINLAVELGLIDELTHLVLAEIMKSIDLINETFGANTSISINVAAKQAGNPEFMQSFARALEATGCPRRFIIEVTEDAFVAKTHFQDEILPDLPPTRRRDLDRRFRHRLFVALGARRHHRRRDQDRPVLHHRHPQTPAQPGHPESHRILERSARHDRDRRRHRDV